MRHDVILLSNLFQKRQERTNHRGRFRPKVFLRRLSAVRSWARYWRGTLRQIASACVYSYLDQYSLSYSLHLVFSLFARSSSLKFDPRVPTSTPNSVGTHLTSCCYYRRRAECVCVYYLCQNHDVSKEPNKKRGSLFRMTSCVNSVNGVIRIKKGTWQGLLWFSLQAYRSYYYLRIDSGTS